MEKEKTLTGGDFHANQEAQDAFWAEINRISGDDIKVGTEVTVELLHQLGDPQASLQVIHVAGTNGKGSVCAMLERCFREAGFRTGLYTSPHMIYYNERMRVDGQMIGDEELLALLLDVEPAAIETEKRCGRKPRFFEILTAMGFLWFYRNKVDILILETGMGGRFDSTNVCAKPLLSIITSISMDHEKYLGDNIASIAWEKAGIIKEGVSLITSCDNPVALDVLRKEFGEVNQNHPEATMQLAQEVCSWEGKALGLKGQEVDMQTPGGTYAGLFLPMPGQYQCTNLADVVLAWVYLAGESSPLDSSARERLTTEALRKGLAALRWPCRLELVQENPAVVLDGSHNPDGIRKSADWLASERANYRDVILVMGMLEDKDRVSATAMLEGLVSRLIVTKPLSQRAGEWQALAEGFESVPTDMVDTIEDCHEAVRMAMELAGEEDLVLCTGSFYVVGEMRKNWPNRPLFDNV